MKKLERRCGLVLVVLLLMATQYARSRPVAKPNVLLITIDTMRADRLGASGWPGAQTPTFDRLAARGLLFEHAFTSVPVTLPAHATLLTGKLPGGHGVRGNSFYQLTDDQTTLAEVIKKEGYSTAAVVAAAVLDRRFGLDQGFDLYDDQMPSDVPQPLIAERNAAQVVARAKLWLNQRDRSMPFFLWVHLFDPHAPYEPPEPFRSRFVSSPYDGEIAYADEQAGMLLSALEDSGDMQNTLVIVTADHGESLGEHGEATHGIFLYDSTLRVPMIIAGPGIGPQVRRSADPVGLVDVLPTVLRYVGVQLPDGLDGEDLIAGSSPTRDFLYLETFLPRDFYNWSEVKGLRSARTKFVVARAPELYDLNSDPSERSNLAPREESAVRRLRLALAPYSTPIATSDAGRVKVDQQLAERLRTLGYVAGSPPTRPDDTTHQQNADPRDMIHILGKLDEALGLAATQRREEAVTALHAILALDVTNYVALHTLGDLLFELGRDKEAIAMYRSVIASGREAAYYRYRLGRLYERQKQYDLAAQEFRRLAELDLDAPNDILPARQSTIAAKRSRRCTSIFSSAACAR